MRPSWMMVVCALVAGAAIGSTVVSRYWQGRFEEISISLDATAADNLETHFDDKGFE